MSSGLTQRSMTVGSETTMVPLTAAKAAYARDALAKAVYARLFEHLVGRVNANIAGDAAKPEDARFIGLLDVFGFEFFGTDNSFEQLAINFANEKLQQFFLKFVFKAEENAYADEHVHHPPSHPHPSSRPHPPSRHNPLSRSPPALSSPTRCTGRPSSTRTTRAASTSSRRYQVST